MRPKLFTTKLLEWYAQHKRDLPWRESRNPYSIWLSEIILQQTRVEQGLPYYHRFLSLFPMVQDLAAASENQVLKAWEGLGYYSRARNLHKTAKWVAEENGGQFPKEYAGLLLLPGVGPYTAAAIASICFEERVPVIDGNVNRFISRLLALELPVDTSPGRRAIHDFLHPAIAISPLVGDFNQALMEYGAQLCTPRNPDCAFCVFKKSCRAFSLEQVTHFPIKKGKVKVRMRFFHYHMLIHEGDTFVSQRKGKGIWKGLYEFILEEQDKEVKVCRSIIDDKPISPALSVSYQHVLSHQLIQAYFFVYPVAKAPSSPDVRRVALSELSELAFARISTRFLEENAQEIASIASG